MQNFSKSPLAAAGGDFDKTERAGTRSDGRKRDRNSADGCGEDRASDVSDRGTHVCGYLPINSGDWSQDTPATTKPRRMYTNPVSVQRVRRHAS